MGNDMKYKYDTLEITTSDGQAYEFDDESVVQFVGGTILVQRGLLNWCFFNTQICCVCSAGEREFQE